MCIKIFLSIIFLSLSLISPFVCFAHIPTPKNTADVPILYIETTSTALSQIKALYGARYYYTNFDLQAGINYHAPIIYTMYDVDINPLNIFIAVDNYKLPTAYDFIYPALGVNYNAGNGASGEGWLICEPKTGGRLMLDPKKLLPGNQSTYITYTEAYIKYVPPYNIYVMNCICTGPACLWQTSTQRTPFLSGTNIGQ